MTSLDWALAYYKQGFSVFPLWKGTKNQPIMSWKAFMTTRPVEKDVIDWWTKFPEANIALVTGPVSGVFVLDTEKDFDLTKIQIPAGTPTVKTGSGGRHFYFKMPAEPVGTRIELWGSEPARKADIKSNAGYVVAPPSVNDKTSGTYEWLIDLTGLALPPAWLLDEIRKKEKEQTKFHPSDLMGGVSAGNRNASATQYIGYILAKSATDIWETVCWPAIQDWNDSNDPPLPNAELKSVYDSISRKEHAKRSHLPVEPDEELSTSSASLKNYDGPDKVISSKQFKQELEDRKDNEVKFKSGLPSFDKFDMGDGFEGGELIVVSGPTKNGKTTFCQTLTKNFEKQQIKSLWFSYEVTPRQLFKRFVKADEFYLPKQLKDKRLDWIESRIIESIQKYDTKAVFIDHLHYLVDMEKKQNPSIEIGSIIRKLKLIAIEWNIVIFLMAHTQKTRVEDAPSAGDVRDSSFIPQEADSTLMIWRKMMRDKKSKDLINTGETFLMISNHRRTGAMGKIVPLTFLDGEFFEKSYQINQAASAVSSALSAKASNFGDEQQIII